MTDVTITTNYEHVTDAVDNYLNANNIQHNRAKSFLDIEVKFKTIGDLFRFCDGCLKFVSENCPNGAYRFSVETFENGDYCLELIDCFDY